MRKTVTKGNRAVIISANEETGPFRANLYVNYVNENELGDITLIRNKFKTLAGALHWADKQLAA